MRRSLRYHWLGVEVPELRDFMEKESPVGSNKFAAIVAKHAQELRRLERYERAAISRRKVAIRKYDKCAQTDSNAE